MRPSGWIRPARRPHRLLRRINAREYAGEKKPAKHRQKKQRAILFTHHINPQL
jgi:hypothetical protein